MSSFVDTNVLIRHLVGEPPVQAAAATEFLHTETELFVVDLVSAETVYVLESFFEAPRSQVAAAIRSLVGMASVTVVDAAIIRRTVEVYETDRLDFAEAYLVACAESTGVDTVVSFDRAIGQSSEVLNSIAGRGVNCWLPTWPYGRKP